MAQVVEELIPIYTKCSGSAEDVLKLVKRLGKRRVRTPREDKVYLHLVEAYSELQAAMNDCLVEAGP